MRAALRRGIFAVDGRASFARERKPRLGAVARCPPAACAACEELKTFAAGRDLTEWGLCDREGMTVRWCSAIIGRVGGGRQSDNPQVE
jgi:hypothetical protein